MLVAPRPIIPITAQGTDNPSSIGAGDVRLLGTTNNHHYHHQQQPLVSPLSFLASPLCTPSDTPISQLNASATIDGLVSGAANNSAALIKSIVRSAIAGGVGGVGNGGSYGGVCQSVSTQLLSYFNDGSSQSPIPPQTPRLQTLTASTATDSTVAHIRHQSLSGVYSAAIDSIVRLLSGPITHLTNTSP